jgi:hypothetical protein
MCPRASSWRPSAKLQNTHGMSDAGNNGAAAIFVGAIGSVDPFILHFSNFKA